MNFHQHILQKEKVALLRITILSFWIVMAYSALSAQVPVDTTMATPPIKKPTKGNKEDSKSQDIPTYDYLFDGSFAYSAYDDYDDLRRLIWMNKYINISYNNGFVQFHNYLSYPEASSQKYDNKNGFGLQWGNIYFLYEGLIGNCLFLGADLTWTDFNVNTFKKNKQTENTTSSEQARSVPWPNSVTSIDYGVSAGPAVMLYPFMYLIEINNSKYKKIRLNLYYHLGFDFKWYFIKDAHEKTVKMWGNGFYSRMGANISLGRFGIGYEIKDYFKTTFKPVNKDYKVRAIEADQKNNRIYFLFRF